MKTAIFLGAGASAAEGAPIQSDLFKDYFLSVQDQTLIDAPANSPLWMKKELSEFFKAVFDIRIPANAKRLERVAFPTFCSKNCVPWVDKYRTRSGSDRVQRD